MATPKFKRVSIGGGHYKKVPIGEYLANTAKNARQLRRVMEKFDVVQNEAIEAVIRQIEPLIIQFVAEDQMYDRGEKAVDGKPAPILPLYSKRTIQRKKKKGQPYDRVTLRDTGRFHKSLRVHYTADGFYVFSPSGSVRYLKYIEARYGKDIYNLQRDNLKMVLREQAWLKKRIVDEIRSRLGLSKAF